MQSNTFLTTSRTPLQKEFLTWVEIVRKEAVPKWNLADIKELLLPRTHPQGGNFMPSTIMGSPINQQGKSFLFTCFCGIYQKNCLSLGKNKDSSHPVGLSSTKLLLSLISTLKVYNLKKGMFHILLTGKGVVLTHHTEILHNLKLQRTFFGTGQCTIIRKDYHLVLSSKHRKYNLFLHIWVLFFCFLEGTILHINQLFI